MPYVRDVDYMPHLIPVELEHFTECIRKDVGPKVSDMRIIVHRRPAGVYLDLALLKRDELSFLSPIGIKKIDRTVHMFSPFLFHDYGG